MSATEPGSSVPRSDDICPDCGVTGVSSVDKCHGCGIEFLLCRKCGANMTVAESQCYRCGEWINLTGFSATNGIAGWLIPLGIGVALTPLVNLYIMGGAIFEMWHNAAATINAAGGGPIAALVAPLFLGLATLVDIAIFTFSIFVAIVFFRKKRYAPKVIIAQYGIQILLMIFNFAMGEAAPGNLMRMLIQAAIWVPYLLVSKRVKATFVR